MQCGAPKINPYLSPYIVCDFCGTFTDIDFEQSLNACNKDPKRTERYTKEKVKFEENIINLVEDKAENELANNKLTEKDNIEQEPSIKDIEGKAESNNEVELNEVVKKSDELINNAIGIQRVPLSNLNTDENRFQARDELNQDIIDDIANNFSDANQDPIHVWTDPKDGKTYVLSGHHRYYGAKKAGKSDVKIIDRTNDFTEREAIIFATEEANANRSMETPLERANTLRKKRERGDSKEEINTFQPTTKIIWLGPLPIVDYFTKTKNGNSYEMAKLIFHTKATTHEISINKNQAIWLIEILSLISVNSNKIYTLQEIKHHYEQHNLEDFEPFWFNKPMNILPELGLIKF